MTKTFAQLVEEAKKEIQEVSVEEVEAKRERGESFTLIDVREKEEYWEGYIEGAVHLSRGTLEGNIDKVVPQTDTPLIVYCAGGFRSALAARSLKDMGYQKVLSMAGGFGKWKRAGYAVVKDRRLTQEQLERYSRHILLTEVGEKGQGKLLDARVLLVGAGGLGSPAAYYLAAAGVGTLGIVDSDVVELSNLQRQILHTSSQIGQQKVLSAQKTLKELNPDIRVIPYNLRLKADNILEILKDYDCVLEGSDNFATKFLVNDACILTNKPLVLAGILRFKGQIMTIMPNASACYRCVFPSPPPLDLVPSCQEAGVIGAVAGLAGIIQATEIIKIILKKGDLLTNSILVMDTLQMTFRPVPIRKNPTCPICSDSNRTKELVDYQLACEV